MKRLMTLLTVITLVTFSLSFTSCVDDDDRDAFNLTGVWEGDFGMVYDNYYKANSIVEFIPDYAFANHGIGYQRDYVRGRYYDYELEWSIRNGRIFIAYYDRYGYNPDLDTYIDRYGISSYHFWGYIESTYFKLYKIEDWYLSKTRGVEVPMVDTQDNIATERTQVKRIMRTIE